MMRSAPENPARRRTRGVSCTSRRTPSEAASSPARSISNPRGAAPSRNASGGSERSEATRSTPVWTIAVTDGPRTPGWGGGGSGGPRAAGPQAARPNATSPASAAGRATAGPNMTGDKRGRALAHALLRADLAEAVLAIDRAILPRTKRHLGFRPALRADGLEHLARQPGGSLA